MYVSSVRINLRDASKLIKLLNLNSLYGNTIFKILRKKAVDNSALYEEAAFSTFAGEWAKNNGFTRLEFDLDKNISRDKVLLKFLKE